MKVHRFTLILDDLSEMTEDAANAFFRAGCDDGSPGSSEGASYVAFDRDAATLDEAVRSAVAAVRQGGYEVSRLEIERDDLAEICT